MEARTYHIVWNDIEIEVTYWPLKWNTISHLEVRTIAPERAPLPITETGYRSHFFQPFDTSLSEIEVVAMVREWIEGEARKPEWKNAVEASRQGELF